MIHKVFLLWSYWKHRLPTRPVSTHKIPWKCNYNLYILFAPHYITNNLYNFLQLHFLIVGELYYSGTTIELHERKTEEARSARLETSVGRGLWLLRVGRSLFSTLNRSLWTLHNQVCSHSIKYRSKISFWRFLVCLFFTFLTRVV